jgi:hypothetical protein
MGLGCVLSLGFAGCDDANAKDVITENIKAMASVVNNAVQNCQQQISLDIAQNIQVDNSNIREFNDNASEYAALKASCLQSNTSVTQLKQDITSAASQVAKATTQQIAIDGSKASTVAKIYADIGESIVNTFVQKCATEEREQIVQNISFKDSNIGVANINDRLVAQDYVTCSTQGNVTNLLKQQLALTIEQEAEARVENLLTPLVIAAAIILGIIILLLFLPLLFGYSFFGSGKSASRPVNVQQELATLGALSSTGNDSTSISTLSGSGTLRSLASSPQVQSTIGSLASSALSA